jgi:uncharacterized repeat protein (TIGR01451 family)
MKRFALLLLFTALPALAQINDHTLTVCAEEKQTSYFPPPNEPIGIPSTGWQFTGKLIGVVAYNAGGDLFTPVGVGFNIPLSGDPPPVTPDQADLEVGMSVTPTRLTAGQAAVYLALVLNHGPQTATGVNLLAILAPGLTVESAEVNGGTCTTSGNRVNCTIAALAVAAQAQLNLRALAGTDVRGTLSTTVEVSAAQQDPNTSNNQATSVMEVEAPPPQDADVQIVKRVTPATARSGDRVTYDMDVRNNGPGAASNVRITDAMPTGVSIVSATSTAGTCTTSATSATCNAGSLASGAETRMTVQATVGDTAPRNSINTATVATDSRDLVTTNNQSSAILTVEPPANSADLQITKSDSADPVAPGAVVRYNMRISNAGPAEATEVVMTDTLPQGVEFVFCSPTCVPEGGVVQCFFPRLPAGQQVIAFVDVRMPATATTVTNRATVDADQLDVNPGNNASTETTTVRP